MKFEEAMNKLRKEYPEVVVEAERMATAYIKRDDAIVAAMQDIKPYRTHEFNSGCTRAAHRIEAMPPADVKPIIRSRWISHGNGTATCEHCFRTQVAVYDFDNWQRFCGDCGAEMVDMISWGEWKKEKR